HSASETKEPVKQGLWGIMEVFIDTFIVCTLTALSLLTVCITSGEYDFTNIAGNVAAGLSGSAIAPFAFTETFGTFGQVVFTIILPLFAFTTILAWAYYGEKAVQYLFGKKGDVAALVFKILYVGLLFVGAMVKSDFVWALDDMFNAMMALPNLVALLFLSKQIVEVTKNYFARKRGEVIMPMLSAYDDMNKEMIAELREQEAQEAVEQEQGEQTEQNA
ncbi:MAG TPA: sodium:alanine symporter family protein, partial [Clostridiales bacterium]|nr:sodium:alanine symporter family protein [Clostridiales bacterium]